MSASGYLLVSRFPSSYRISTCPSEASTTVPRYHWFLAKRTFTRAPAHGEHCSTLAQLMREHAWQGFAGETSCVETIRAWRTFLPQPSGANVAAQLSASPGIGYTGQRF
eukprot:CAMPEP_0171605090 /NCGR_PEP_ID=MMETSP0990-20121206/6996_1 /TAXON_ID=483369 /ORGANISM="non described non described, Strain CCMP2098" /LENGTH=108 /DNA_ID=CAMNT_0012167741 /DNA_START=48 /DNA_END=374 /DNA_ORIENTATION=+